MKKYKCPVCGKEWAGVTNRRANQPLNKKAVEEADKEVWTKCKDRLGTDPITGKGRKLTMSQDDYLCRRRWMDAYLAVLNEEPKPEKPPKDPVKKCPYSLKLEIVDVKGKKPKKFIIATLPPPRETPNVWSAKINKPDEIPAKIKYIRRGSTEADIPWKGGKAEKIYFKGGKLNFNIQLVDGAHNTPKASVKGGILTISAVQQGDTIVVEEQKCNSRDQLSVVKNFTWNDLERQGKKLTFASHFAKLPHKLRTNIINTILFIIDPRLTSEQAKQREAMEKAMVKIYPGKGLATLNIPSAMGVGIFPDDASHFHFALSAPKPKEIDKIVKALEKKVESEKSRLGLDSDNQDYEKPEDRKKFVDHYKSVLSNLVEVLTKTCSGSVPFTIYHTYEIVGWSYVDPAGKKGLIVGDPIRNIKTSFVDNKPKLFDPPDIENASSWFEMPNTYNVRQLGFYINKYGSIVIYEDFGLLTSASEVLQVADALGET